MSSRTPTLTLRSLIVLRGVIVLGGLIALAAGCDDAVDPTLGTDQAFTLYGVLDPTADRQALRVIPIADRLDPAAPDSIDAEVVSIENGVETAWDGTVVTFGDGTIGHVFVADYTPRPGATVRVEARRSDGAVSSAEVAVPALSAVSVGQPDDAFAYPLVFDAAPQLYGLRLEIDVTGYPDAGADTATVDIPLPVRSSETDAGRRRLLVPFADAVRAHLSELGLVGGGVELVQARYVGFVTSREWEIPEGGFDPDVIVEPGTQSNVAGGFGYVGAGYEQAAEWLPSVAAQVRAGFTTDRDPARVLVINEVGGGFVELYNRSIEPVYVGGYRVADGADRDGSRIAGDGLVPGEGYLAVPISFAPTTGTEVLLLSPNGTQRLRRVIEADPGFPRRSYGSFPDGVVLVDRGRDLFALSMEPTPGAPNEPAARPVTINEVYADGAGGWVEVVPRGTRYEVLQIALFDDPRGVFGGVALVEDPAAPFAVGTEGALRFALPQSGGEVFAQVDYTDTATGETARGVVAYRRYGPLAPGTSSGYLPDGHTGAWTEGLAPTRGAPNRPR